MLLPRILAGAVLACLWLAVALCIAPDLWLFAGVVATAIVVMVAAGLNPFMKRWR